MKEDRVQVVKIEVARLITELDVLDGQIKNITLYIRLNAPIDVRLEM